MNDAGLTKQDGQLRLPTRLIPVIELSVLLTGIAVGFASWGIIEGQGESQRLLTPPLVALLLVANLVPWMALLVLLGRRVAMRRAAAGPLGGRGTLHVRLVALFSLLASVPMLLVTVFASLLFQYGVEFWSSSRARGLIESAQGLASSSYNEMLGYVDRENIAMADDFRRAFGPPYNMTIDSLRFQELIAVDTNQRSLSEAILFSVSPRGEIITEALVNPYERDLSRDIDAGAIRRLRAGARSVVDLKGSRIRSITRVPGTDLFLFAARAQDMDSVSRNAQRALEIRNDYSLLLDQSRTLQLRFNAALMAISLLIVGLAVLVALRVADRLVRPVGQLVDAAGRVASGDLAARVPLPKARDEIGTLASAFNSMTERLEEQTGELVSANAQIESRRALIEAVMSGVSAGVISVDAERRIRLINASAGALLRTGDGAAMGRTLGEIAPELDGLIETRTRESIVQLVAGGEARTLAVKIAADDGGHILTFDDITEQLTDQRRAAWSDVARRIAHEIKNPLTPIQLAAERLQRRYGKQIEADDGTFARLTETIVRQVGDLRRMVDEFSSFARMPKPVFRPESIVEVARHTMFLHEVAHPEIDFVLEADEVPPLVCDRRQIGQALTNLVKNAAEAVGAREGGERGRVTVSVIGGPGTRLSIAVADNGIGLPVERHRIAEPYMTTRKGGTGLGLAIVRKIVEEHFGTIGFTDRAGGGTVACITLDTALLDALDGDDPVERAEDADAERLSLLSRSGSKA